MRDKNPKSYKNYTYICRYESFPFFYDADRNRYYYGLTSRLNRNLSYVSYTVKPGDNYDSIALYHYGCSLYYWVICDFNDILDCLVPPVVGTVLKIPAINNLSFQQ